MLSDGDAGLWRLQREALPNATMVLDWWHAAVRFEHALHMAEYDATDQEHLRQITQGKLVAQAPEHHEGDDVARVLRPV